MPLAAAFRWLWPGRTELQGSRTEHWDTREPEAVDVGSGYGVSVDDGDSIEQIRTLIPGGTPLTQATSGDRPTVDLTTVPGALLVSTINDDHMLAAVTGQIATIAIAFRDDGASTTRHLLSRDTIAVTDKPAIMLSLIEE